MQATTKPFDMAIIGAGPAGAYLAYRLAAAGVKIALFDPKVPWEKPCGGGITHKAWSRFPLLTDPALVRNEVSHSLQISPGNHFWVVSEGHPLYLVDRKDLSALMLAKAVEAGAAHYPLAVEKVETWGSKLRLTTADEDFYTGFAVGADGVHSLVRRCFLGPLPPERTLTSIVQFYEGGPADPVLMEVTSFPGYVWSFPRRNYLCVGAGAMERGRQIKPALERFLARYFPDRRPYNTLQGALLPYMKDMAAYREPRSGPNWALIGDAAGFCDTLTGEGILYAVWSADLLAEAYLAERCEQYDRAWRQAFGRHLRWGAWAAKYLYSPRNIDRLFTQMTVCPTFHQTMIDFVWNLPSYPWLLGRLMLSLPRIYWQWRRFRRAGGAIDRKLLYQFEAMADRVKMTWP